MFRSHFVCFLSSIACDIFDDKLILAKKVGADVVVNTKTQDLKKLGNSRQYERAIYLSYVIYYNKINVHLNVIANNIYVYQTQS